MGQTIGVLATRQVAVGVVEDNALTGPIRVFPEGAENPDTLRTMTGDQIAELIGQQVLQTAAGREIDAVGVGFPGVIRNGIVEESPNLQQIKGFAFAAALCGVFRRGELKASVLILNDADAIAAGVAATRGHLEKLIRIWYLGDGVGFGRYPQMEGVWEGGHMVVSLDPKENYCGCGGVGHLEGIMGHRAMRLRFLDMEPEEVFAAAREGDSPLRHIRQALAPRAGGRLGQQHPSGWAGQILHHGAERAVRGPGTGRAIHSRDGQDDPATGQLV
jgi:glucokinase